MRTPSLLVSLFMIIPGFLFATIACFGLPGEKHAVDALKSVHEDCFIR